MATTLRDSCGWVTGLRLGFCVFSIVALAGCDEGSDDRERLRWFASERQPLVNTPVAVSLDRAGGPEALRCVAIAVYGDARFSFAIGDVPPGVPGFSGEIGAAGGVLEMATRTRSWILTSATSGPVVLQATIVEPTGGACPIHAVATSMDGGTAVRAIHEAVALRLDFVAERVSSPGVTDAGAFFLDIPQSADDRLDVDASVGEDAGASLDDAGDAADVSDGGKAANDAGTVDAGGTP